MGGGRERERRVRDEGRKGREFNVEKMRKREGRRERGEMEDQGRVER